MQMQKMASPKAQERPGHWVSVRMRIQVHPEEANNIMSAHTKQGKPVFPSFQFHIDNEWPR
jgi:hypothetical protein